MEDRTGQNGRPNGDVLRPTDSEGGRLAKTLVREARYGALAAIEPETAAPSASRVAVATDTDGTPLVLVSSLAPHTGAMQADPRVSLLVGEPGKGDPLAHPRITLACRAERLERGTADEERAARRYLNRHPKAKLYAGFADFAFFRLNVEHASLNGGFGKAYALTGGDIVISGDAATALAEGEQPAIDHMNRDHRDAVQRYAVSLAGVRAGDWRIIGIDAEGCEIAERDAIRRIFFPRPVRDMAGLRAMLVELAKPES